jgi:hypothetical protein
VENLRRPLPHEAKDSLELRPRGLPADDVETGRQEYVLACDGQARRRGLNPGGRLVPARSGFFCRSRRDLVQAAHPDEYRVTQAIAVHSPPPGHVIA